MLALILKRHLPFILSATAAALFLALGAVAVLLGPQRGDARALGDPSAPPPAAAAEPAPVGQPPIARPAALPPEALAAANGGGGGGMPANLIEARTPDERFHPAALAAVRCAIGREVAHDPALDAVAAHYWRSSALGAPSIPDHPYNDPMVMTRAFAVLTPFDPQTIAADPCAFGRESVARALALTDKAAARVIAFGAAPFVATDALPGAPPGVLSIFVVID